MPKKFVDIKLTVPYGHIAGKAWGSSNSESMILALHGWQDNAGTFDRLIPLMPESVYVLAIDLPGHGFSSHLPPGCAYNDLVFIMELKRIVDYLNLKSIIIFGHSMGAAIALFFSCLFPQLVEKVIAFDMIKPLSFPPEELAKRTRAGIESFLSLEQKMDSPPIYDHKTSLEKLITSHAIYGKITEEAAECLLVRGSRLSSDGKGEYFTRDNRLKALLFQRMDSEALSHYLENIECQLLIIKSKSGVNLDSDSVNQQFLQLYRNKCKYFKYVEVDGGHHIHLCEPEIVIPYVLEFLQIKQ